MSPDFPSDSASSGSIGDDAERSQPRDGCHERAASSGGPTMDSHARGREHPREALTSAANRDLGPEHLLDQLCVEDLRVL